MRVRVTFPCSQLESLSSASGWNWPLRGCKSRAPHGKSHVLFFNAKSLKPVIFFSACLALGTGRAPMQRLSSKLIFFFFSILLHMHSECKKARRPFSKGSSGCRMSMWTKTDYVKDNVNLVVRCSLCFCIWFCEWIGWSPCLVCRLCIEQGASSLFLSHLSQAA